MLFGAASRRAKIDARMGSCQIDRMSQPKPRGFAAMKPQDVSEIARKGGIAAHKLGTAHEFSAEEAKAAGRKGARIRAEKRKGAEKADDE